MTYTSTINTKFQWFANKARKGVIYPLKTGIYALVGFSERTFTRNFFNKGVRYAQNKISACSFHSFVSFAHKIWCTLATLFNSACLTYIKSWLYSFRYGLLNYEYYSDSVVMFFCVKNMLRNSLRNCLLTEYCPHSVGVHSFKLVSGVVFYTGLLKISNYLDV